MAATLDSKPVLITGMHRSGTSAVASLLNAAGVNLGERLMPAAEDNNADGFFENLDFVEFHERALSSAGENRFGWVLDENISIPQRYFSQADDLIEKNETNAIWGWKDPRTTLFLDFWAERLPGACFLFVYRKPWQVIDSLFRRGDEIFQNQPELALTFWLKYNRRCLDYFRANPSTTRIVDVDEVARHPFELIQHLNATFGFNLSIPEKSPIDLSLINGKATNANHVHALSEVFPEAISLLHELQEASWKSEGTTSVAPAESTSVDDKKAALASALMDNWMSARKSERDLKKTNQALYEVRSELYHAKERITWIERSRIWKLRNAIKNLNLVP